jgi:hypothetical protein
MSNVSRRDALRAAATAGAAAVAGPAAASQTAEARAPKEGRLAQIFIGEKGQNRTVRVSHPGQLTPEEIGRIDKVLINSVIKDLTGCACLSGTIDVIWERNFDKVLDVRLG